MDIEIPFYESLTFQDLIVLSNIIDSFVKPPDQEGSYRTLLDAVIFEFPNIKQAFLEFYGCYVTMQSQSVAEARFFPIFTKPLKAMENILTHSTVEEPEIWKIHLAKWRLAINK